jgi:hypothetical protein
MQSLYDFHSGFWINLHHFLYELADARRTKARSDLSPKVIARLDTLLSQIDTLPLPQRQIWNKALVSYERVWILKDLLLDDEMMRIKLQLASLEGAKSLTRAILPSDLKQSLKLAAPIYRKYWWPEHDRTNRKIANDLAKRVQSLGTALTKRLAMLYRSPWPSGDKLRVEMVPFAGRNGAYTSVNPTFTVYESNDPRKQGWLGFEILLHETSHAMTTPLETTITRICQEQGRSVPEKLWHVMLFYTTGEVVRQTLASQGIEEYIQYADANGVYERAGWSTYRQAIALHWQPYIDGQTDFNVAIKAVIDAVAS